MVPKNKLLLNSLIRMRVSLGGFITALHIHIYKTVVEHGHYVKSSFYEALKINFLQDQSVLSKIKKYAAYVYNRLPPHPHRAGELNRKKMAHSTIKGLTSNCPHGNTCDGLCQKACSHGNVSRCLKK